jgi:hypothetical protein
LEPIGIGGRVIDAANTPPTLEPEAGRAKKLKNKTERAK